MKHTIACCLVLLGTHSLSALTTIGFDNVTDLSVVNVEGEFRFEIEAANAFLINNSVGDPVPSILANRDRAGMVFYRTDGEPFVFDSLALKAGINAPNTQGYSPALTLEGYSFEEDRVVGYEFFTTSSNEFQTFSATEFDDATTRGLRDIPIDGLVLTALHDEEGSFTAAGRIQFDNIVFGDADQSMNPPTMPEPPMMQEPPVVPEPPMTGPNTVPEPNSLSVFAGLFTTAVGFTWVRRRRMQVWR